MEAAQIVATKNRRPEAFPLRFPAVVYTMDGSTLLRLPGTASQQLPSRGQVAVRGAIDGHEFQTVLEPDGRGGHWMRLAHHCDGLQVCAQGTPRSSPSQ